MKHRKATWQEYNLTSKRGCIVATMAEIEAVFGPPHEGVDLSHFEWDIVFENGVVATIYDHRWATITQLQSERFQWHVGGHSDAAPELVAEALGIDISRSLAQINEFIANGKISGPLDDRTDNICRSLIGKIPTAPLEWPPHKTEDGHAMCRCVVVPPEATGENITN